MLPVPSCTVTFVPLTPAGLLPVSTDETENAKDADMNIDDYVIIPKNWNGIEFEVRRYPDCIGVTMA